MKPRFFVILAFLLTALLLTACPPTTQVPQPPILKTTVPVVKTTVIIEEDLITPTPDLNLAYDLLDLPARHSLLYQ
jgi:hypothetical protein